MKYYFKKCEMFQKLWDIAYWHPSMQRIVNLESETWVRNDNSSNTVAGTWGSI